MKPLNITTPHLIIVVGIPGSGKSFFAEHFQATFNAPYISFERITTEMSSNDTIEQSILVRISNYLLDELLKTNQTVVYEGSSDTRTSRQLLSKIARDNGYEPLLVWVQTESLASKLRATKPQRGKSSLSAEQFDTALQRFTPPNASEKPIVISGKHTYASQLKIVLKHLAVTRAENTNSQVPERTIVQRRQIAVR